MPDALPGLAFGVPVPYSDSVDALRAKAEKSGPEGWAACLALGQKPEKEALELLTQLARRDDWTYRNLAVQGIGRHPMGAQAAETLVAALADPVAQIVRTACDAVATLHLAQAHRRIVGLLSASDPQTRLHAVRTLGDIWVDDDYPAVIVISTKDKADFVRKEAARTLRRTVSSKTWKRLFDRWKLDRLPALRVSACELLTEFGADKDMPELRRLVRDSNVHVREAAEKTAGKRCFRVTTRRPPRFS